jgi:CBS domain-containing protein
MSTLNTLKEIMSTDVRCIEPDATLVAAAQRMKELDVGAVPICDHDRLGGMVTDRDIIVRGIAAGRDPAKTLVREVMTAGIVYGFEDQDVEDAVRIMEERQIRRLPVLNRQKRLVGIVSLCDIARRASQSLSGEAVREISEPAGASH